MKKWLAYLVLGAVPATVFVGCGKSGSTERATARVKRVQASIFGRSPAPIRVGDEARDFTLPTLDGKTFRLSSFEGKKVVVLGIGNPYG